MRLVIGGFSFGSAPSSAPSSGSASPASSDKPGDANTSWFVDSVSIC